MIEPKSPVLKLHSCPYLGIADDRQTVASFAHPTHRCFAQGQSPISMQRQVEWCLTSDYRNCRYYPRQEPASAVRPEGSRNSSLVRILLIALMLTTAITLGIVLWNYDAWTGTDTGFAPPPDVIAPTPTAAGSTSAGEALPSPTLSAATPSPVPSATLTQAASLAPTPTSTQPPAVFTVFAAHGQLEDSNDSRSHRLWLDTGILLTGSPVVIQARGFVSQHDGAPGWSPMGMDNEYCMDPVRPCAAPRLPQFALVGRVEGQRWPFLIGEETTITAEGRLFLAFNDGYHEDNCVADPPACGEWTVTIDGEYLTVETP